MVLSEKVLPIEHVKQAEKEHFKCTHCDFQSSSKAGLKIHMKRKHTDYTKEEFPRSCDQCDKIVNNISDMKKHLKTHSYKDIQFQCSFCHFCNFCSGEQIEMEVHIGKEHSDKFECGHCEINTKDKEEL